jgi:hypothetical protein
MLRRVGTVGVVGHGGGGGGHGGGGHGFGGFGGFGGPSFYGYGYDYPPIIPFTGPDTYQRLPDGTLVRVAGWASDMDRWLGIPTGPVTNPDGTTSPDPNEPPGGYFPNTPEVSFGVLKWVLVGGVTVLGLWLVRPLLAAL